MTLLILKILIGGGILATIYRIYLAVVQGHMNSVLDKADAKVKQDMEKDDQDAKDVKSADQKLNDAINKFDNNNK